MEQNRLFMKWKKLENGKTEERRTGAKFKITSLKCICTEVLIAAFDKHLCLFLHLYYFEYFKHM